MRKYPLTAAKTIVCVSLISFVGCFSEGVEPPEANSACTSDDSCPYGYTCQPPTNSGVIGMFCCKDENNCGPKGSGGAGGSVDGPLAAPDGSLDGGRDIPGAGGGFGGSTGRGGATGSGGIPPMGGRTAGGAGGTTDAPVLGTGGSGTGGFGGGGSPGTGGLQGNGGLSGTGGQVTGTGGKGMGGQIAGTGGKGTGGQIPGTGGKGTGGQIPGTGGASDTHVNQPTLSPTTGATITSSTSVVVTFDEAMKTESLSLSGTLGTAANAAWSGASKTLTLTPIAAKWPEGANKHLGFSVTDLAGNAIVPIDATYSVLDGVVYVKTTGSDSNPGTSDSPKATIPAAITQAAANFTTAEVHVAKGTYNVSFDAGTHIVMKPGIAVMGGYSSSSWAVRDWNANTTTIQDTASTGGDGFDYKEAVYFNSATNAQSIIDGFTIIGPSGVGRSIGVYVSGGSPIIRNNKIYAGTTVLNYAYGISVRNSTGTLISHNSIYGRGSGGSDTYGVCDYQSASRIEYNYVEGGAGGRCAGIDINSSSSTVAIGNTVYGGTGSQSRAIGGTYDTTMMTVENNVVHGGAGTNVYGVYIASPGIIRNNTICGGVNGTPHGIAIGYDSAAATIDNNIIFSGSSTSGYGIYEGTPDPTPSVRIRNNDIWNCPSALYRHSSGSLTTIAEMESYLAGEGTTASGNISVDPKLISLNGADNDLSTMNDNNWSLNSSSSVKTSGLNGAKENWDFTTDITETARTPLNTSVSGWSMGAYEVN